MNVGAESFVYLFVGTVGNSDINISIDGKKICNLNGSTKKVYQPYGPMQFPMRMINPCYRKICIKNEGKIIVSSDIKYQNAVNGSVNTYKAEFPIDIEDGQTYYLEIAGKGFHDMQIKEVKEKKALKKIEKDEELPTITYEE